MHKKYGAVDIGTAKVKTLIASVGDAGDLDEEYASTTLTCFGSGIEENRGAITDEGLENTIAELKRVSGEMDQLGVSERRAVSTHTLRRAKNRDEVIRRITEETGFAVEVIDPEEEARLFFGAVMRSFPNGREYAVVDVGGGTVQILVGSRGDLTAHHSMKTGTITLHEAFTTNPHDPASFTTERDILAMKAKIVDELQGLTYTPRVPVIYGSSMVIDIMKAIRIHLDPSGDSVMHPYETTPRHLQAYIGKVLPLSYKDREEKLANLPTGYMWGIDKGFLNIVTIAEKLGSERVIPTNANVAQGIVYALANSD